MKARRKKNSKLVFFVIIIISSLALTFILSLTEPFIILNNNIYDIFFRTRKAERDKTANVAIVDINDVSLRAMQEKRSILWPWSRNLYALVADYLVKMGAKAVVFDILFSSPDIDRADSFGEDNDYAFADVINNSGKIILSYNIDKYIDSEDKLDLPEIKNAGDFKYVSEYKGVIPPYYLFTENNKNLGYVEIEAETDGVIRQYIPFVKIKGDYCPSLAATTYLLTTNKDSVPSNLVLNRRGKFAINWYGPGGYDLDDKGEQINQTIDYFSFNYVFENALNARRGLQTTITPETFKDKVVFIGSSARGLLDQKNTPFTVKGKAYPGVEIHATAYLNMAHEDWIKKANIFLEITIFLLLLSFLVYFGLETKSFVRYSLYFMITFVVVVIVQYFLFSKFNIESRIVFFFVFTLLTFLSTLLVNYILVGMSRNIIKNAFGAYLSPDLLKKVSESAKPLETWGEELDASAMFIDIQGFTTFSEKNAPEKVVEVLNEYLKAFCDIIINNRGLVNKFLGDGLMALFGAPTRFSDHSDMAVKSAFECYKINKELSRDFGLNVRIGVNSGKMILGNIGGGRRLEYTAIGDNVNLASRLEGANKFFDTRIMVGENTYNALSDKTTLDYLGKFSVKGKDIPVGFYFYSDGLPEDILQFKNIVKYYENENEAEFIRAMKYFDNKNFGPAAYYKNYYEEKKTLGKPIKLMEK
ncbi:MAG TPA: adenylate/guanylate cyclase domain-containing protein [Spirochaetota bacterium]|jgi:adenylate cyclase|nr:MAG: Adenylate cyclase 1 [Spirochaetes bacterium ADurb.Bin133]HNZ26876.1 adenylate/guanylate cyclase domain-containing protein [Spirochaetota bacterium]HPY87926.1 adenylate/guanylate cyclase domain-containing protein [Spirochaetota bacterium]